MNCKEDPNLLVGETDKDLSKELKLVIMEKEKNKNSISYSNKNLHVIEEKECIVELKSNKFDPSDKYDDFEFTVCTNHKIRINKSLIPLRTAQFFWFGGGKLSLFFSVIMKNRGLSLIEFSTIFSLVFLCQFIVSYISGIVADKIGNAKPLLMFNLLATLSLVICILIAPNVKETTCLEHDLNVTCLDNINIWLFHEYCYSNCLENETVKFLFEKLDDQVNKKNYSHKSSSPGLMNEIKESTSSLNGANYFCNQTCSCLTSHSNSNCFVTTRNYVKALYVAIILSFFSFWSTTYRFLDFTAVCLSKKANSHFGKERSIAITGEMMAGFLAVFVLNLETSSSNKGYDSIIYISIAMMVLSFISVCYIKNVLLPPGRNFMKNSFKLMKDLDIMIFLFVVLVAGSGYSFSMNFHLLLLDSLKTSKSLMAFLGGLQSLYGIPVLLSSRWLIQKFGTTNLLCFGLFCRTLNMTCFSFLYHPWISCIIESTSAFSFHLLWATSVVHSNKIAPEGFAATLNAVAGTTHFGIGRSCGVSLGGLLVTTFGMRKGYRVFACIILSTAIFYYIFRSRRRRYFANNSETNDKE